MATALLFPGQGSQTDDMRDVVAEAAPELLDLAVEEVGVDPFERVAAGTRFAQPALYCASVALWLRAGSPQADFVAGHSLGELGALVAGGSVSVEDGLRLAARRGRAMQEVAAAQPPGGMLALLGDEDTSRRIAGAHGLTVANDNAPGQLIVSGSEDRLAEAAREAKASKLKAMRLAVRGAFHTRAMAPALAPFTDALEAVDLRKPRVPVFSSTTAAPFSDVASELAEALTKPVRWRETLQAIKARGTDRFVEVGPGKVLKGLVRRTLPEAEARTLSELEPAHA